MDAGFNKWWFLPSGVLLCSTLVALGIIVFEPFVGPSAEVAERSASKKKTAAAEPADCSGEKANDYACHEDRYKNLVYGGGVGAAFDQLENEYETTPFVTANCHQMTHYIGRAAAEVHGDLPATYGEVDAAQGSFCWSGYYHGAMESIVAEIGPDRVLNEADEICSDLGEDQKRTFLGYNCFHGLGHGFMGIQGNELFESLETCDKLRDEWERGSCYSGAFMENVMAANNPTHPTKYLKTDEPLYPCTDVEERYKNECYKMQTSYALETQDYDFSKIFELCSDVESDYRPTCYQSLGRDASGQMVSDVEGTSAICKQGQDYEARENCVIGAVLDFVSYYSDDEQAKELCGSFDADLRETCLKESEEFYRIFDEA